MENLDKILELLQKKSLTVEESRLLKEFAESDTEIGSFINIYNDLDANLLNSAHIHADLLSSYILYEMGDDPENKILPIIRNKIKTHLRDCMICKNEYDELLNEYNEVKEHVHKNVIREQKSEQPRKQGFTLLPGLLNRAKFRYTFVALTVLIIGYIGLFSISSFTTPFYKKNIFAQGDAEFYTTRGRTSVLFQQGLNSIEGGDYEKAIKFLNEDIITHKNDKSIFYSYYIIGITYLKAAESDFAGLFKSFDRQDVELAISNLRESIERNNSGDYENLKLDSYYYIGRAYLLIDDSNSAKSSLQKVIDGKGKFSIDSQKLIEQMEKN
jgi:tetratricopeptide (TPR) repeat protein